jgi:hypothetical protein
MNLGRRRRPSKRRVRADGVVPPPSLDEDLRLPQRVEDFAVEQLVAELGVEALDPDISRGRCLFGLSIWRDLDKVAAGATSAATTVLQASRTS